MQKLKSLIKQAWVYTVLAVPLVAFSQGSGSDVQKGLNDQNLKGAFGSGGLLGATDATDLITKVIKLLLLLCFGVAVMFVIIGGYFYITSAGNEETAEKGKKTLINAIIGIVVIVLAYAIINVIVNQISK